MNIIRFLVIALVTLGSHFIAAYGTETTDTLAARKFSILVEKYKENKEFSSQDIVEELSRFYLLDLTFIKEVTQDRKNHPQFLEELNKCDQWVQASFPKGISFSIYAKIGYLWAELLDYRDQKHNFFDTYQGTFDCLLKEDKLSTCLNGVPFENLMPIPLIHVSQDGLIPLDLMNKGLGFFDNHNHPRMTLWFGVGTNKKLCVDGLINQTASAFFAHDMGHAAFAEKEFYELSTSLKSYDFWDYVSLTATLRKSAEGAHLLPEDKICFEKVFFHCFHEGNSIKIYNVMESFERGSFQFSASYEKALIEYRLRKKDGLLSFFQNLIDLVYDTASNKEVVEKEIEGIMPALEKTEQRILNGRPLSASTISHLGEIFTEPLEIFRKNIDPSNKLDYQELIFVGKFILANKYMLKGFEIMKGFNRDCEKQKGILLQKKQKKNR